MGLLPKITKQIEWQTLDSTGSSKLQRGIDEEAGVVIYRAFGADGGVSAVPIDQTDLTSEGD